MTFLADSDTQNECLRRDEYSFVSQFRRRLFVLAIWVLALVALTLGDMLTPNTFTMTFRDRVIITEDDPRWDCRTMGNRICGERGQRPNTQ